jgi:hypothetical protein
MWRKTILTAEKPPEEIENEKEICDKKDFYTALMLCVLTSGTFGQSKPKTGITAFTGSMRNFGKFSLDGY